jgi:hypothetical protein
MTKTFSIEQVKSRKRATPEADLQKQLFDAMRVLMPHGAFYTHFPMGGGGFWHGMRMKRLGAVRGVPDVLIIWEGKTFWLELKSPDGTLSLEQRCVGEDLRKAGCRVEVARSVGQALGHIRSFGIPLRDVPYRVEAA